MAYWDNITITGQPGRRKAPVKGASTNHRGLDVVFKDGKVRPEVGGTVYYSGNMDGYGNIVVVKGDDGNFYHYAHNAANRVNKGQRVNPNDVIATMGNTGTSSGPHTHIEVTDAQGNNLHPQTRKSLGMGGNKLASQNFYGNSTPPMVEIPVGVANNQPTLIDPTQDIGYIGNAALEGNQALAAQHLANQLAISQEPRFDLTRATAKADENIQQLQEEGLQDVNAQMNRGVVSPQQMALILANAAMGNQAAAGKAEAGVNQVYQDLQQRPGREQLGQYIDTKAQQMRDNYIISNPLYRQYYENMQNANNVYQLDPQAYMKSYQTDAAYKNALNSFAAAQALSGNPEVGNVYLNEASQIQPGQGYLNKANAAYQAQVASQLGVPIQVAQELSKNMADYNKEFASPQMSAYNQSMQQPEMNFRTVTEKTIPALTNLQENTIRGNEDILSNLNTAQANYIKANQPGADIIKKAKEQQGENQVKQPERIADKYETYAKNVAAITTPQIQGQTAIAGDVIQGTGKAASNINDITSDWYVQQMKNEAQEAKNAIDLYKAKNPAKKAEATPEDIRTKDTLQIDKMLFNSVTNRLDEANIPRAIAYMKSTGRYTPDEVSDYIDELFPGYKQRVLDAKAKKGGK